MEKAIRVGGDAHIAPRPDGFGPVGFSAKTYHSDFEPAGRCGLYRLV